LATKALPSWGPAGEIVALGARIHLGRDISLEPRWLATVVQVVPNGLEVELDPADLEGARLEIGHSIVLGFGAYDRSMRYVLDVLVVRLAPSRIFVAFTSEPRKAPRRGSARAALAWPVRVSRPGGPPRACSTINVSATGALIAIAGCAAAFDAGEIVELRLEAPDRAIELRARIVRIDRDGDGPRAIAVQYLDRDEAEEMQLQLQVLRGMAGRYVRIRSIRPCRLVVAREDGPLALEGATENISGTGVLMRPSGGHAIRPGERGQMTLALEPGAPPVVLEPVIVTRIERDPAGDALVAVDFAHLERDLRSAMVEFVMEQLRHV
jgi:hypothetical protein